MKPSASVSVRTTLDYLARVFPAEDHDRVFLVGGAVRDILMGLKTTDLDLAAALSAQEFRALGFRLVEGRSTSAVWFRHDDAGIMEVTPLKTPADLDADLRRRDFCCNALAMALSGELMDPLKGKSDLDHRLVRACSPGSFTADPLRVFRAFRFLSNGWSMAGETEELIRAGDWRAALSALPVERFSREMFKALAAREPQRFFRLMLHYDAGQAFLPELFRMPPIPAGPVEHHPEGDLFTHSIEVLERTAAMTAEPLSRFCALFHDIGKLATPPEFYPRHHGHNETGTALAYEFCRRLRLPAHCGTALAWISRLHRTMNMWDQLRDSTRIRTAAQALKAGIADMLPLVSAADKGTTAEHPEWRSALQVAGMSAAALGVDQQLLQGMPPAQRGGYLLQKRVEKLRTIRTSCA